MGDYMNQKLSELDFEIDEEGFNIDTEQAYFIDLESISEEADKSSDELVKAWSAEEECDPKLFQKIKQYRDTLRLYFKMLKTNEEAHDILIKNLAMNPSNASLYTGLNRLQSGILDIRNNIDKTIATLDSLMTIVESDKQLLESNPEEDGITTRGSRDFIKSLDEG